MIYLELVLIYGISRFRLWKFLFILCLLRFLIMNGCQFGTNIFRSLFWGDHMISSLCSFNMVNYIDLLYTVKSTMHYWDKLHVDLLCYAARSNLLSFHLCSYTYICERYLFSFIYSNLSAGFVYRVMLISCNKLRSV
jgi:hypothetical protein